VVILALFCRVDGQVQSNSDDFSFVFMTDIHITPLRHAPEGFSIAIESVNKLKPDFVITGGDLVFDAMAAEYVRADSLYNLYTGKIKKFNMPVYNTMGNHEIFGWFNKNISPGNEYYGKAMFNKRIGKNYYAFSHKGWRFYILDGIVKKDSSHYTGLVSEEELEWLKNDLKNVDKKTPLVICTHIPFITVYSQVFSSSTAANDDGMVVTNSKDVLGLFKGYNLKIVLQGHLHYFEDILVNNIHFITGGAVSGAWWGGQHKGTQEGYVIVEIKNNKPEAEYFDYEWDAMK
jgi:3',5'-cyclic AMP phosphodiesterase CpdA